MVNLVFGNHVHIKTPTYTHACIHAKAQGQPVSRRVYSQLVYFCNHEEEEIRLKSLVGLGESVSAAQ